jgi:DNA-binding transcriptional MerR regulator
MTTKSNDILYTSGDLARHCEVTLRTIDFYQKRGLIVPIKRQGEGYRYYNKETIERVQKIKILQTIGLSLSDIREVIDLYFDDDGGVAAKQVVLTILKGHLVDADRQIAELQKFREGVFRSIVRIETILKEIERKAPY